MKFNFSNCLLAGRLLNTNICTPCTLYSEALVREKKMLLIT